jgi:hypothetical protein
MFIDQATIRIKAGDGVASSPRAQRGVRGATATIEVESVHVALYSGDSESLCYRRSLRFPFAPLRVSVGMD